MGLLTVNYEKIMVLTELPRDYLLFAGLMGFQERKKGGAICQIIIFGEKYLSSFNMRFGRI